MKVVVVVAVGSSGGNINHTNSVLFPAVLIMKLHTCAAWSMAHWCQIVISSCIPEMMKTTDYDNNDNDHARRRCYKTYGRRVE